MSSEDKKNQSKLYDFSELSERLGVSSETLESVLTLFYEQYHALPEICDQLIKEQDWLALQALVHKMKGSCSSLQMHALCSELDNVEHSLKRGERFEIKALEPLFSGLKQVIDLYQLHSK